MTGCIRLADRVVEVAHAAAAWTPEEEAHLARCGECRAAWRLALAGARMGAGLPALDPDRIASGVRTRLAEAGGPRTGSIRAGRRWLRWAVPAAAAALVALAIGVGRTGGGGSDGERATIVELDDLDVAELEQVAEAYPEPLDVVMPNGAVGLSDLTSAEMERILVAWEG